MNNLIDKGPEEAKRKQDRNNLAMICLLGCMAITTLVSLCACVTKTSECNNWKRLKLSQDTIIINQEATINMLSYGKH